MSRAATPHIPATRVDEPHDETVETSEHGEPYSTSTTHYRARVHYRTDAPPEIRYVLTTVVSQHGDSEATLDPKPEWLELPRSLRIELPNDAVVSRDPLAAGDADE